MDTLSLLLSTPYPPPFIYLHHPHQPTTSLDFPPRASQAKVDAIECYTHKILWSAIISRLDGTMSDAGLVDSLDGFIRALKSVGTGRTSVKGKGKGKEKEEEWGRQAISIVITKAERLPKVMGSGWAVMTRLAELAGIPLSVILVSSVPWDELRPPRGDAIEPIHLYIGPSSREDILRSLSSTSSHPLYPRFLDLILTTLLPLTSLPCEIEYLSTTLWPIYTSILPPHLEQNEIGIPYPDPENPPPPLGVTVKLLTDLKHQLSLPLTAAIENVLTLQIGRVEFTHAMMPSSGASASASAPGASMGIGIGGGRKVVPKVPALELPMVARYLLVAGYCASYNPAKSDLRLFGRATGPDRKMKKGGGTRRAGYGRVRIGKVPQRLQGPKPFPLDRLLAIFAALYAEHAPRPQYLLPTPDDEYDSDPSSDEDLGEYLTIAEQAAKAEKRTRRDNLKDDVWDEHVEHLSMSVKLWSMIPELEGQGLLRRVSPIDRLDNIMLRCEVDYETVKGLAKDLKIILDDYIYEAVQ